MDQDMVFILYPTFFFFPNFAPFLRLMNIILPNENKITFFSTVTDLQNVITHLKIYVESKFK